MSDHDIVIAGGGHNALACAALLSMHGLKVLVAERNAWVGGGAVTAEVARPGFKHDLFGASHVWCHVNPDFRNILRPELEKRYGLKYLWSEGEINGHPLPEGPGIVIHKSVDKTCDSIAEYSKRDAKRYREIFDDFDQIREGFVKAFFSPPNPPSYQYAAMENNPEGLCRLRSYNLSSRAFVEENFENTWVRSAILSWAMGPHVKPDQEAMGASSFYIMIPAMHEYGQAIPEGGSMELPKALARLVLQGDASAYPFSSYQPLHEGHRYRVHRSSRIDLFARAELHVMGGAIDGHRIGPDHCLFIVPEEKRHAAVRDLRGW